jgi:hypothetical protein
VQLNHHTLQNWGDASNPWFAGNVSVADAPGPSEADQDWRVSTGLDLFTKLGLVDLAINYYPPADAAASDDDE